MTDLRFALRQFRTSPGFFFTAVLVLGLGMCASVTVFAFVNAALLKPLPYQDPARLVAAFGSTTSCPACSLSYLDYKDWKEATSAFRFLEVWQPAAYLWHSADGVEAVRAGRVSGGFFAALGVTPALGRLFIPADDMPAAPRTVVLPWATWQRLFAGRTDIVGKPITLDSDTYTVIGVLPHDFTFAPRSAQVWVTIHDPGACERDRSCRVYDSFARLKDGVSLSAAEANLATAAAQLQKQYPQSNEGQGAALKPLSDAITGDIRPVLLALLAGSDLLLLIAWVNVAGLLLVRAEKRRREMAVRSALGGTVARLARQLVVEAALLVALSLSCGVATAWWAVRLLAALIPERVLRGMPYFESVGFDRRVLVLVGIVGLMTWMVCVAAPFSRLFGKDLRARLAEGARGSAGSWGRFGAKLVVIELAVAMVLLVAAGILGKSFYRTMQADLNFDPSHLATFEVDANSGYESPGQQLSLAARLRAGIMAQPGVESFGIVQGQLPVSCNCETDAYRVQGRPWQGTQRLAVSRSVSSTYLPAIRARLIRGRFFAETDDASRTPVVLINRKFAQQWFPGEDPVGRTIGDEQLSPASLHQVIGVVDDVREGTLNEPIYPAVYLPFNQNPGNYFFVVVRTAQDPARALPGIIAAIHALNPEIGLRNEFAMSEHIHHGAAFYLHSSAAWLAGAFAACALILGVIGLYGVMAYAVSQRTSEIGIRMALGAERSAIRQLILREAAGVVLLGLMFGMAASLFTTRFLQFLLFGVGSWDPIVLTTVSFVFALAALVAAWIPAARAASTDPIVALRTE